MIWWPVFIFSTDGRLAFSAQGEDSPGVGPRLIQLHDIAHLGYHQRESIPELSRGSCCLETAMTLNQVTVERVPQWRAASLCRVLPGNRALFSTYARRAIVIGWALTANERPPCGGEKNCCV